MLKNFILLLFIALFLSGCISTIEKYTGIQIKVNNNNAVVSSNEKVYKKRTIKRTVKITDKVNKYEKNNASKIYLKYISNSNDSLINRMHLRGNLLAVSDNKVIKIWDLNKKEVVSKIFLQINHKRVGSINTIKISPNKKYLVVGGFFDGPTIGDRASIHIYDIKTSKLINRLKLHTSTVHDFSFSEDGKYLVSISNDLKVGIWNMKKFSLFKSFSYFNGEYPFSYSIMKVKINKKEIYLSYNNQIEKYSIKSQEILSRYVFNYPVVNFDVSEDKVAVITSEIVNLRLQRFTREIILLDKDLYRIKTIPFNETKPPKKIYFTKNSNKILIVGINGIYLYDIKASPKILKSFKKENKKFLLFSSSYEDNKLIFYNVANETINVFNTNKFSEQEIIANSNSSKMMVSLSGNIIGFTRQNEINLRKYSNKDDVPMLNSFNLETFEIKKEKLSFIRGFKEHDELVILKPNKKGLNKRLILGEKSFFLDNHLAWLEKDMESGFIHSDYVFFKDMIITSGINEISIYNKKGYKVANLYGQDGQIFDLQINNNRLISSSTNNTVSIWDLSKIKDSVLFKDYNKTYNKKEFTPYLTESNKLAYKSKRLERLHLSLINYRKPSLAHSMLEIPSYNPLVSIIITDDNNYLVWTPEGYFSSSEEVYKNLGFHLNQSYKKEAQWISLDKLYGHLYRPDLVKYSLAGGDISSYINKFSYKKAIENLPPSVSFKSIGNRNKIKKINNISLRKVKIKFNIKANKGGVGVIRVYQEGKLVKTIGRGKINRISANVLENFNTNKLDKELAIAQKEYLNSIESIFSKSINGTVNENELISNVKINNTVNKEGYYSINLGLKAGNNNIAIEAFNKTNTIASIREKIIINAKIPKRESTIYAIIAGVNKFENSTQYKNLNYSENDANSIKEILEKNVNGKVVIKYLIGKDLTKDNINKAIKEIKAKAKLEDKIIFYISTHGKASRGDLYLSPQNNKKVKNWIKFEEMFEKIQSINALDQIFIIDACESGKAKDIVASIYDSKASVLAKQSGVHVLLATTKGTFAFEHPNPKIKHGVFTNNILNALNDKTTDKNKDNKISIIELSKVLKGTKYSVKHQYPVIRNVGQDTKIRDFK